jgi:hypothetical protein
VLDGPQPISDTYLEIYLQELHTQGKNYSIKLTLTECLGYAIFFVNGILPNSVADEVAEEKFTIEESLKDVQQPAPSAPSANEFNEDDQMDLAIALSLSEVSYYFWNYPQKFASKSYFSSTN